MCISDWSSDVCSSDLGTIRMIANGSIRLSNWAASTRKTNSTAAANTIKAALPACFCSNAISVHSAENPGGSLATSESMVASAWPDEWPGAFRSEEHTSELQSLMRSSYAVFSLKTKDKHTHRHIHNK